MTRNGRERLRHEPDLVRAPDSREFKFNPPQFTLKYRSTDEPNDDYVRSYTMGAIPASVFTQVGTLYLQDIEVKPDGYARYIVTAPYGPLQKQTGTFALSFDTTGATVKIKASREHIQTYYPASSGLTDTNPHKGLIGVKPDGDVEGDDIIAPALKLNCNFKHPQGVITISYIKNLARCTGCTNLNPYLGFDAGELLFIGGNGSEGSACETEVNYGLVGSQNATGLTIAGITGIAKGGHHSLWIEWDDKAVTADGARACIARAIHIERVADPIDFATNFGWG